MTEPRQTDTDVTDTRYIDANGRWHVWYERDGRAGYWWTDDGGVTWTKAYPGITGGDESSR